MRPMQRVISAGFATAAIASASVPALAWTVWPDVDFEWYANVGRPLATVASRDAQVPTEPTAPYTAAMRDREPARIPAFRDEDRRIGEPAGDARSASSRDDRATQPAEAMPVDEVPK